MPDSKQDPKVKDEPYPFAAAPAHSHCPWCGTRVAELVGGTWSIRSTTRIHLGTGIMCCGEKLCAEKYNAWERRHSGILAAMLRGRVRID
jgi:hypothetical protein